MSTFSIRHGFWCKKHNIEQGQFAKTRDELVEKMRLEMLGPSVRDHAKYLNEIRAKTITHIGSYYCRTIARSKIFSEHSYGTALDISDIDGSNVKLDWDKNKLNWLVKSPTNSQEYILPVGSEKCIKTGVEKI